LLSIAIDLNKNNVIFLNIKRKTIYLTEDLSRLVFMDMKLEHASIIDKRISSFALAVMEIFKFILVNWLLGYPEYSPKVTIPRKN
jgi:hypothetical protein